jgi:hypothetical protein
MSQKTCILIVVAAVILILGAVLGIEAGRRQMEGPIGAAGGPTLSPGAIPIIVDGLLVAGFEVEAANQLEEVSFIDDEEGKEQRGWLLRDVLLLYVDADTLAADSVITVSSSSREKSAQVTWNAVKNAGNMVMLDLTNRGTLKLVSKGLPGLATRDEWVQDVDKIEVTTAE